MAGKFTHEELTRLGWRPESKGSSYMYRHPELFGTCLDNLDNGRLYFYNVPDLDTLTALTCPLKPTTIDTPYGSVTLYPLGHSAYMLEGVSINSPFYKRSYGPHGFSELLIRPEFRPFVQAIAAAGPKNLTEVIEAARAFKWETEKKVKVPWVGTVTIHPGMVISIDDSLTHINQSGWNTLVAFFSHRQPKTVDEGVAVVEEFIRKARVTFTCCD